MQKNHIITMATGEHFNLPGHSFQNMKFTIIERVKKTGHDLQTGKREIPHIKI